MVSRKAAESPGIGPTRSRGATRLLLLLTALLALLETEQGDPSRYVSASRRGFAVSTKGRDLQAPLSFQGMRQRPSKDPPPFGPWFVPAGAAEAAKLRLVLAGSRAVTRCSHCYSEHSMNKTRVHARLKRRENRQSKTLKRGGGGTGTTSPGGINCLTAAHSWQRGSAKGLSFIFAPGQRVHVPR